MIPSRKPAVVRGFAASTLATFVALAGHVTGGGEMPGPLGILVPWLLSSMVCVLLAGQRLSVVRLTLAVSVSQFLFHVLFVLGTTTAPAAPTPHVHGSPLVLPAIAGAPDVVAADGAMWIGHVAAVLVTVAGLHRGERMLLTLRALAAQAVRWVQRRVDAVLVAPAFLVAAGTAARFDVTRPLDAPLLATIRGRAPPVLVAT